MQPFVSILIPCYNAERWIAQAIESALAQTSLDKEIIVVDDGSTDRSLNVIRSFNSRILWETGPNRGGNARRWPACRLGYSDDSSLVQYGANEILWIVCDQRKVVFNSIAPM
jgi:glycosyltransferase involved in cell wall biosynthesis